MAREVKIAILGSSASLTRAAATADGSLGKLDTRTRATSATFAKFGKIAAASTAVVGASLVAVALKSASTYKKVGGEVLKLQRYTGLTAEAASRLRVAAKLSGLDVDKLTRSLGLLSKNIVAGKAEKLGFDLRDAAGKALPLNDALLKVAARLKDMPNGAEKTALALQLFGRAGADLLPFLNRGADGIAELMAQSDKLGATLSGKDLEAVKASTAEHRKFGVAMEGLQIQIGRYVLPVLTTLATAFAEHLPGAIRTVRDVMARVGDVINTTLLPAFDGLQGFIGDKVVPVIRGVYDWLKKHELLMPVIAGIITGILVPAVVSYTIAMTEAAIATVVATWPFLLIAVGIALVTAALIYGYQHWAWFREGVDTLIPRLLESWRQFTNLVAVLQRANDAFGKLTQGVQVAMSDAAHWVHVKVDEINQWLRSLLGPIGDVLNKLGQLGSSPGSIGPIKLPGIKDFIPFFDDGGMVPGPRGKARLIVAHGGETVLPTHKGGGGTAVVSGGSTIVEVKIGEQVLERILIDANQRVKRLYGSSG